MPAIAEMTEEESFRRGVFAYTVGGVRTLADPLKVLNRMYAAVPEFDDLVAKFFAAPAEGEDPEAAGRRGVESISAAAELEPAVLAGFGLAPLADDGSGLSTTECMSLLAALLGWQDRRQAARERDEARTAEAPAGGPPEVLQPSAPAESEPMPAAPPGG